MGESRRMGPAVGLARGTLITFPIETDSFAGKDHRQGEGKFFPQTILSFLTEQIPKLDYSTRDRLAYLAREKDPKLFAYGLLHLAQSQQQAGKLDVAQFLYAWLAQQNSNDSDVTVPTMIIPKKVQNRARQHLGAMLGFGDSGRRLEFLSGGLLKEILNPTTLGSLAIAGGAYHWIRGITLARLGRLPAGPLTRGFGGKASASLLGFAFEATLFPVSAKGIDELLGRPVDWSHLNQEIKASILFLGGIKLGGWGSFSLLQRMYGLTSPASRWIRLQQSIIPPAGMFLGSLAGHRAGQTLGIVPTLDGATTLTDSAAMFLQYSLAGTLLRKAAPRFLSLESPTDVNSSRAPHPSNGSDPIFETLSPSAAWAPSGKWIKQDRPQPWKVLLPLASKAKSELRSGKGKKQTTTDNFNGQKNIFRSYKLFTEALRESKTLPPAEKLDLIRKAQAGDQDAKGKLIQSDLLFLTKTVRRYRIRQRDFLDVVQEAALGYFHALKKFEPERGVKFLTYANWWVKTYIHNWLNHQPTVFIPDHRSSVVRHIKRELEKREPQEVTGENIRELARELGVKEKDLQLIEELTQYGEASIDKPSREFGGTLQDIIPSQTLGPDQMFASPTLIKELRNLYLKLNKRDREIFRERFLNEEGKTLLEIGKNHSVSRERIRQLQEHLRRRLKKIINNIHPNKSK